MLNIIYIYILYSTRCIMQYSIYIYVKMGVAGGVFPVEVGT